MSQYCFSGPMMLRFCTFLLNSDCYYFFEIVKYNIENFKNYKIRKKISNLNLKKMYNLATLQRTIEVYLRWRNNNGSKTYSFTSVAIITMHVLKYFPHCHFYKSNKTNEFVKIRKIHNTKICFTEKCEKFQFVLSLDY